MALTTEQKGDILSLINEMFERDFVDFLIDVYDDGWEFENSDFCDGYSLNFSHGATKVVFSHIYDDNTVIKIGLLRYDREQNAYMDMEYEHYLEALKLGLEDFFPETELLGTVDGYKIYSQARAEVDNFEVDDRVYRHSLSQLIDDGVIDADKSNNRDSLSSQDSDSVLSNMDNFRDNDIVSAIFADYSLVENLLRFIQDFEINDLHSENFGFIGNRPVIIDFSGYYS